MDCRKPKGLALSLLALATAVVAALGVASAGGDTVTQRPDLGQNGPIVFDFVPVGSTSGSQSAVLTNNGSATITITGLGMTGPAAGDFHVSSNGCAGATLAFKQSCSVALVFKPTVHGTRVAYLVVSDSRGPCANFVTLAGSGTDTAHPATARSADCVLPGQTITNTVTNTVPLMVGTQQVQGFHATVTPACASHRRILLHLSRPAHEAITQVRVFVNGHLMQTLNGKDLRTAAVDLRGRKLARYDVRLTVRTARGRTLRSPHHHYVTCVPRH